MERTTSFPNFIWHYTCVPGEIGIRGSKDSRAGLRKYLRPTNERKQMSTKTMKQRIALVAVSALTAGLFSVVSAPVANANSLVITPPAASRAGVATTINLVGSTFGGIALTAAVAQTAKIAPGTLTQPSGSTYFVENAQLDGTVSIVGTAPLITSVPIDITPTTAGTHSMTIYLDVDSDGVVDATEPRAATSFVVGGVATQLILSQSSVSVTKGEKVTMTLTALDASNRRTLLDSGATSVVDTAANLIESATAAILVSVNASATAEAITAGAGGPAANSATTASNLIVSGTDTAGSLEITVLPTGFNYVFGEAGTYVATTGSQVAAGTYVPSLGAYRFAVNTAAATGTVTVSARVGTTSALGVYTNVLTATSDATITLATALTTPVAGVSLGISSSQTGVSSTTNVATLGATTTTTVVNSITANVTQPTVNYTLSLAGGTGSYGVYVMPNVTNASAGSNNTSLTSNGNKVIPDGELDGRFQRVTLVDGSATFAVTNPTPAAGETYTVFVTNSAVVPGASTGNVYVSMSVTYAASSTNTTNSTLSPASAVKKFGESTVVTVKVRDQFDVGIANRVISYTVAGRNPVTTAVQATTNADGNATITLNDIAATTATALSDTVTVDLFPLVAPGTFTETLIITYNSVGSVVRNVTLTVNSASDAVIEYDSTPWGTVRTFTATVLDANGLGLPGVPVVINVPAGASPVPTTSASGDTDAAGQFAVSLWSTRTGTKSVTATAGGVTSAAALMKHVQGSTAAAIAQKARSITVSSDAATAKSEGIIQIIATAKDLYGNNVAGVEIKLSESGVGRFLVQSGSNSSVTAYTSADGTVTADLTSTSGESGNNKVTGEFTGNAVGAVAVTSPADWLSLAGYVGTTAVSGAAAGIESATQTVTFGGGTAAVSNADVLKSIVALIASINKQIQALQKLILRR